MGTPQEVLYEDMLNDVNDEDIPDLPCTAQATVYGGGVAALHVCKFLRLISEGRKRPFMIAHDVLADQISLIHV